MRLLIVEDNPDIRELLIEMVEDGGYAADGVGNVTGALAALAGRRYDLVILDLLLPDGDGTEVLRHLRRGGGAVPVLVCSGRPDAALRTTMFDDGADAVLDKPFSCRELMARVRALLRRSASRPAATAQSAAVICASRSAAAG